MPKFKLILSLILVSAAQFAWSDAIVMNKTSVGPITKNTPYDLKALQTLLPNYEIKKNNSDTIAAYRNKQLQFTIIPKEQNNKKSIYLISSKSSFVKESLGTEIGSSFASIYAATKAPQCMPAQEEMSGLAMCSSPYAKNIVYVFAKNKTWNGPDNTVPPLAVLKDWKLQEVIWMANDLHTFKNGQFPAA